MRVLLRLVVGLPSLPMKTTAEKIVYLDTLGWGANGDDPAAFIAAATSIARSKNGGARSGMETKLDLREEFAWQLILGIPEPDLTWAHRCFAETASIFAFGKGATWIDRAGWKPVNPNRTASRTLANTSLDWQFMESLGLTTTAWSRILMSESLPSRSVRGSETEGDRIRAYFALKLFRFPEPEQFFKDRG